jgi:hypothetical protein
MKIKILKPFETTKGQLVKGDILDITPSVAERWVAQGDAEYVREPYKKSVPENNVIAPPENKAKAKRKSK